MPFYSFTVVPNKKNYKNNVLLIIYTDKLNYHVPYGTA